MLAADGLEALAATTKYLPDVIVTDTPVRKIDGLVADLMPSGESPHRRIPVLVLTGDVADATVGRRLQPPPRS